MTYNLLGISGSLRKGSFNTSLLNALKERLPEGATMEVFDIGTLPLYNQDQDAGMPQAALDLKAKAKAADAIVFVTPEYNRSIPGVLKNAIDWASRPYGDNAWAGKPVFVMGATGGHVGTAVAQYALKQSLLYLDMRVMGQPEFFLGSAQEKFDGEGNLTDESTKQHIDKAIASFLPFIDKLR